MASPITPEQATPSTGTLVVVGTGILWAGQTTLGAQRAIEAADRVLFAVADPWAARWVQQLNPRAEPLPYGTGAGARRDVYREMVERILAPLREGLRVCAVFYGHPGVLTDASHEAVRRARAEGHTAGMLPGVSFLDCLYADLGLDPGRDGCQVFEATDFLVRTRAFDAHSPLVLCQVGLTGNRGFFDAADTERIRRGLGVLTEVLRRCFPATHQVMLYEAATLPVDAPRMEWVPLEGLPEARVTALSTLFVPPLGPARADPRMLERLGLALPAPEPSTPVVPTSNPLERPERCVPLKS